MTAIAIILSAVLAGIAVFHLHWGLGGVRPARSELHLAKLVVGAAGIGRMPSSAACIAVAAILAVAAFWPLSFVGLTRAVAPRALVVAAGVLFAIVFILRGAAGYTPVWRTRFPEEPFASLDRSLYSPLCLAIGTCFALLLGQDALR